MKKLFTDLKPGSTIYGTYQKDWDKPTSEHFLVKCKVVKNRPYEKRIDISDSIYDDPVYRIEQSYWIEVEAKGINAVYQRDYDKNEISHGYMLIYGRFIDHGSPELLLFANKKDAVNYIVKYITEDINRHEKQIEKSKSEIERLTKQREKFEKTNEI